MDNKKIEKTLSQFRRKIRTAIENHEFGDGTTYFPYELSIWEYEQNKHLRKYKIFDCSGSDVMVMGKGVGVITIGVFLRKGRFKTCLSWFEGKKMVYPDIFNPQLTFEEFCDGGKNYCADALHE